MKNLKIILLLTLVLCLWGCNSENGGSLTNTNMGTESEIGIDETGGSSIDSKKDNDGIADYATSFALTKDGNTYAIFDEDGNQLTDFIYTGVSAYQYINNSILVSNNGTNYILDEKGEVLYSSQSSIDRLEAIYYTIIGENEGFYDKNGNRLFTIDEASVEEYGNGGRDLLAVLYIKTQNKIKIINGNGKVTAEFDKQDDFNYDASYLRPVIVRNGGKSTILNRISGEIIDTLDGYYKISLTKAKTTIRNYTDVVAESDNDFRYYEDLKFVREFSKNEFTGVWIKNDDLYPLYVCTKDYKYYYLKATTGELIPQEDMPKAWVDENTFLMANDEAKTYVFYVNGKETATVSQNDYRYAQNASKINKSYFLTGRNDGLTYVFNCDGTKVSEQGYKDIEAYYGDYDFGWYSTGVSHGYYGQFLDANLNPLTEKEPMFIQEYRYADYKYLAVTGDKETKDSSFVKLYDGQGNLLIEAEKIKVPEIHSDQFSSPYIIALIDGKYYAYTLSGKRIMEIP